MRRLAASQRSESPRVSMTTKWLSPSSNASNTAVQNSSNWLRVEMKPFSTVDDPRRISCLTNVRSPWDLTIFSLSLRALAFRSGSASRCRVSTLVQGSSPRIQAGLCMLLLLSFQSLLFLVLFVVVFVYRSCFRGLGTGRISLESEEMGCNKCI